MKSFFAPVSKNHSPGTPKKEISAPKNFLYLPKKQFFKRKVFHIYLPERTDFLLKEKFLILAWKRNQFLTVTRKTISQTKSFLYLSEKIHSCPHQSNFLNKKIFTLIWKNRFSSTLTWRGRNLIIHSVLMLSYSYCLTVTFGIHSIVIAFLLVPYYHCLIYTVISIAFYCFVIHSVLIFFFFFCILTGSNTSTKRSI